VTYIILGPHDLRERRVGIYGGGSGKHPIPGAGATGKRKGLGRTGGSCFIKVIFLLFF